MGERSKDFRHIHESNRNCASESAKGKRRAVLVALEDVLKNVDSDSSSVITSEAYGLIRWNTEYLADKLKELK